MTRKNKNFLIQYKKQQLTGIKKNKQKNSTRSSRETREPEVPKTSISAYIRRFGALCSHHGLPRTGIASDTWGSVSVTRLWKTVSDRRMVTPARDKDGKGVSVRQIVNLPKA